MRQAKVYSRLKYCLIIVDTAYLLAAAFIFQKSGLSKILVDVLVSRLWWPYALLPAYLFIVYLAYIVLGMPLHFYGSFIVEHAFGLSSQTVSNWLKDQLKSAAVSYIVLTVLFGAFYGITAASPRAWWLIVSVFWIFFSLVLAKIAPTLIIPLFFKYKPVSDNLLKERIKALASKMGVKILDVFEIDLSTKTLKANAALVGWGAGRRVLLADTLNNKYSHDEVEVILAHEFAHYKLGHLLKLIAVHSLGTLVSFFLIFKTCVAVMGFFKVPCVADIAGFPVIVLYMTALGILLQPLAHGISRKFEKDADIAALKATGFAGPFISMMEKLSLQNLTDRAPGPVIKFLFFDHPPIEERIALASRF